MLTANGIPSVYDMDGYGIWTNDGLYGPAAGVFLSRLCVDAVDSASYQVIK